MKNIKSIYYHIDGTPMAEEVGIGSTRENYVRADVYYSEGGYSYFTYKNTPRAYFMSVHMVGRGKDACGYFESTAIFQNNGAKMLLQEVTRQSKKREAEALAYFEEHIDEYVAKIYPDLKLEREVA